MSREFTEERAKVNGLIASFVKAQGYDPASLVSTETYMDLLGRILQRSEGQLQRMEQAPEEAGSAAPTSQLYRYLREDPGNLRQEEKRRRLLSVFEYQDERIFIQQGADISYYPVWYRFPAHYHTNAYFDVAYVFCGCARFYFPDLAPVDLRPGDLLVVPSGSRHGECAVSSDTRAITCSIRNSVFLRLFLSVFDENAFLQSFFRRMLSGGSIPYLLFDTKMPDGTEDVQLRSLFTELMEEQDEGKTYYSKMMDALMSRIFVWLLRYHEQQLVLPESVQFYWKPEYDAIFHFIEKNSTKQISLDELAEQFHYSRRQLTRIIRECTGQNYSDLIRGIRMRLAKELLSGTTLSIEEIAWQCGYRSFSSFSRAFSETEHMTPGQYRQRAGTLQGGGEQK